MAATDLAHLKQVLDFLWRSSAQYYRGARSPRELELRDKVAESFKPLTQEELMSCFGRSGNIDVSFGQDVKRKYLFMKPSQSAPDILPIISMQWKDHVMRLRLGLFTFDDKNTLSALGFRFESPEEEGVDSESSHGYYHAQLIESFDKNDPASALPRCPAWLPTRQPAFLLSAKNPLEVFFVLLISLYGAKFIGELQPQPVWNHIAKTVQAVMTGCGGRGVEKIKANPRSKVR